MSVGRSSSGRFTPVHREQSADDLDPAADARRTGQPLVAGDKDDVQQFGEGYVGGGVRVQVLSQFPTASAWPQRPVRAVSPSELSSASAGAKMLASTTITILPEDLGGRLDRHSSAISQSNEDSAAARPPIPLSTSQAARKTDGLPDLRHNPDTPRGMVRARQGPHQHGPCTTKGIP